MESSGQSYGCSGQEHSWLLQSADAPGIGLLQWVVFAVIIEKEEEDMKEEEEKEKEMS